MLSVCPQPLCLHSSFLKAHKHAWLLDSSQKGGRSLSDCSSGEFSFSVPSATVLRVLHLRQLLLCSLGPFFRCVGLWNWNGIERIFNRLLVKVLNAIIQSFNSIPEYCVSLSLMVRRKIVQNICKCLSALRIDTEFVMCTNSVSYVNAHVHTHESRR